MTPAAIDLGLQLPAHWRRRSDPTRGILVAARAPTLPPSGRRPAVSLRCCVAVEDDLLSWRESAITEIADRTECFSLEEANEVDLFGHHVAYRRFAYRDDPHDVLCDQWAWLHQALGITLTCSAARAEHADFREIFEAIARSVDLDGRVA